MTMSGRVWLKGGTVVDGTGEPSFTGDVWLQGDRIVAVYPERERDARADARAWMDDRPRTHDCRGKVIAPGFIDVHTHDDAAVLNTPDMLPKISQGVTTVVAGNCGISLAPVVTPRPPAPLSLLGDRQYRYTTLRDYAAAVDAARPAINVAALLGHTALRIKHVADLDRPANAEERAAMAADMREAMDAGALGLSSGVFYREAYAADVPELVAVARVAAERGGVYATHIRDELKGILEAMMEAAGTARQAGLPLVLSHHKCAGAANWGRTLQTLPLVDRLAGQQELAMDVYPYTAGSTVLREDLVDGVIDILITRSEPHPEAAGRYLRDIAAGWGVGEYEACVRLKPGNACYFQMREDDVRRVIAHPLSMIGSDGLPNDERPHPRLWGAFPRVLAQYWREKGVLSLAQAVHKMTGMSARRFRMGDRGVLAAGKAADVVVFDPDRIRDTATFEDPMRVSEGVEAVWVNGVLGYTEADGVLPERGGRFVRRQPA
ncbi:D-aminoacylase [Castellaniella denitrificans]